MQLRQFATANVTAAPAAGGEPVTEGDLLTLSVENRHGSWYTVPAPLRAFAALPPGTAVRGGRDL